MFSIRMNSYDNSILFIINYKNRLSFVLNI